MQEEAKEYYTIEEVSRLVGRNRATIYNRMKILEIEAKKFNLDRKAYVTEEEMQRIKTVFDKPWLAGEKPKKPAGRPRKKTDAA